MTTGETVELRCRPVDALLASDCGSRNAIMLARAGGTGDACFRVEFGHGLEAPAAVLTAGAGLLLGGVAPAARSANQCTFTDGEWTRCIQVTVSMPAAPAVGATAPITVAINSQVDLAAAATSGATTRTSGRSWCTSSGTR
ncbi:hypothetical protein [Kutzneria chonburiensis]|uniref:Uncharacterized protein n=1 Tax=Kutzneria chonburiensis TaxID=1483604 RepID=A0ABV6MJB5_9PSEU|nr:hypothetical protein [Kutzneria chonburiensis]